MSRTATVWWPVTFRIAEYPDLDRCSKSSHYSPDVHPGHTRAVNYWAVMPDRESLSIYSPHERPPTRLLPI